MAAAEAKRADGIEAVSIVTPNFMHAGPARAFLKAGIHVICDKPLALSAAEAKELVKLAKKSGKIFAVTHNYTGYPMIRQAREMIAAGELGELRHVQAEYAQDWLAERVEATGQKQADWRTDPKRSGAGGALGDIGTHAYNLLSFVTGLTTDALLADLTTFVKGRKLDDNDNVLLRFKGGAKGMLWASQVAVGNENALTLRVYGTKGGVSWKQEEPNVLWFTPFGQQQRKITRGGAGAGAAAGRMTRVSLRPPGRLPRRLRQHLQRDRPRYPRGARRLAARSGGHVPDGGGWPQGHGVHRGGGEVERQGRRLGEALARLRARLVLRRGAVRVFGSERRGWGRSPGRRSAASAAGSTGRAASGTSCRCAGAPCRPRPSSRMLTA